jgi:hypothetical protein
VISEELGVNEDETKSEDVKQEENEDEGQISATAFDINVPQFPIKEE